MKIVKVRVNKTIEYEVSVPVQDEYLDDFSQIREYVDAINWEKEKIILSKLDHYFGRSYHNY